MGTLDFVCLLNCFSEARWRYLQGILPQELQKAGADYHAEKGFG